MEPTVFLDLWAALTLNLLKVLAILSEIPLMYDKVTKTLRDRFWFAGAVVFWQLHFELVQVTIIIMKTLLITR